MQSIYSPGEMVMFFNEITKIWEKGYIAVKF